MVLASLQDGHFARAIISEVSLALNHHPHALTFQNISYDVVWWLCSAERGAISTSGERSYLKSGRLEASTRKLQTVV